MSSSRFLGSLIAVLVTVGGGDAAQKPIREVPLHIDATPAPADVAGLVAKSRAVLRIVVTDIKATQAASSRPSPPVTIVTGQVREAYAKDSRYNAANTVVLLVPGGDTDRGNYVERARVPGTPEMSVGKEYIVFLDRSATRDAYMPILGFAGVFEVQGQDLVPYGRSAEATTLRGLGAQRFIQQLRDAVRAQGKA